MMSDGYLILKNLLRKPLRFCLTLFAIFMAFLIMTVLISFQLGFDRAIDAASEERLITVSKINFTVSLPVAHVNKIRAVEHVEKVAYANWFGGYFNEPTDPMVMFAVSAEEYLDLYDELVVSDEAKRAFLTNRQAMLAGAGVAEQYGWKVGDLLPMRSNIFQNKAGGNTWDLQLAGTFTADDPAVDTNYVIFHYENFNESKTFGKDSVGWMILKTDSPANNEAVIEAIDTQFSNSPFETSTSTEKAFNKAFVGQLGNIALIITSVVGAAMFVILMIVGNAMVMAVRERTGEIAVLKTLGFQKGRIFGLVIGESLALSALGGLLGLGVASLAIAALSAFPQLAFIAVTSDVVLIVVGVALALGLSTGYFPARSAMNINLITAFQKQ